MRIEHGDKKGIVTKGRDIVTRGKKVDSSDDDDEGSSDSGSDDSDGDDDKKDDENKKVISKVQKEKENTKNLKSKMKSWITDKKK